MTAGAQNIKKETVNESQSRGQNNGGQTRQRFTGGDVQTAQRRMERRSTALGIRRVQTKTPRDRRTARRARGWNERQTNPSVGKGGGQLRLRPRRRGAKQGGCSRKRSGNFSSSETDASALGHVTRHFHAWVSAYPGEMEMRVHTKRT